MKASVVSRVEVSELGAHHEGALRPCGVRLIKVESARARHRHVARANDDPGQRGDSLEEGLLERGRRILGLLLMRHRGVGARRIPDALWERRKVHGKQRLIFLEMRERWEALEGWQQAAIGFPPLFIFLFLMNYGPFAQPLGSSIIYGIIEGGLFTAFLLLATASEKSRREGGDPKG